MPSTGHVFTGWVGENIESQKALPPLLNPERFKYYRQFRSRRKTSFLSYNPPKYYCRWNYNWVRFLRRRPVYRNISSLKSRISFISLAGFRDTESACCTNHNFSDFRFSGHCIFYPLRTFELSGLSIPGKPMVFFMARNNLPDRKRLGLSYTTWLALS